MTNELGQRWSHSCSSTSSNRWLLKYVNWFKIWSNIGLNTAILLSNGFSAINNELGSELGFLPRENVYDSGKAAQWDRLSLLLSYASTSSHALSNRGLLRASRSLQPKIATLSNGDVSCQDGPTTLPLNSRLCKEKFESSKRSKQQQHDFNLQQILSCNYWDLILHIKMPLKFLNPRSKTKEKLNSI